jgi:hypothetical protein
MLSLRISMSLLTTKDELKSIRDTVKILGDPLEKVSLRRLFSPWPWNQTLSVDSVQSLRPARLGRALMNSLRTITDSFSDWSELQQRNYRDDTVAKLNAKIDDAIASGEKADLLLVFSEVRDFSQRVLTAEFSNAARMYHTFPFPEFKEIEQGRQAQVVACPRFFDELYRRFTAEARRRPSDEGGAWIVGAHISFFQHFKAGDSSVEDSEELVRLGKRFSGLSTSGDGGSALSSKPSARVPAHSGGGTTPAAGTPPAKGKKGAKGARSRSAPPSGGGGVSTRSSSGSAGGGSRYTLGVTLPCSEGVIGPHLGIPGPAFQCHHCEEEGHWKGECPVYWGSLNKPLPGWKADGKKDKKAWDGENPKKETFKDWVKFIRANFENNGQPARVDGAPAFDDYKDRAVHGAGP